MWNSSRCSQHSVFPIILRVSIHPLLTECRHRTRNRPHQILSCAFLHVRTRQWAECFDRIEFNLVHCCPAHWANDTRNDKINNNHSSYCRHAFLLCLLLVFSLDVAAAAAHFCNWSVNKRHKNRENHTQYWFLCAHLVGSTQWTERWLPASVRPTRSCSEHILQFFGGNGTIAVSYWPWSRNTLDTFY